MKKSILFLTLLFLSSHFPLFAQIPAWATACENAPAAEQILCWINNARTDPAAMAAFIQWKLDKDPAFKQWATASGELSLLTAETLPMLRREKTCPPPYPGREQPMKIIANNLQPLSISDVLRDLGKLHLDVGMKICPDGKGNQYISHCDVNGNGDIEKVKCLSANLEPSDLKACIYWGSPHATKAGDFKIFQSFVSVLNGHSHVRPFFDIDGTNTHVGYFMDDDAHLIFMFSNKQPEKHANNSIICAQKGGLCPKDKLPGYAQQYLPCPRNTMTNFAKGKTASQSTTAHDGDAKRAVDDNTDGDWNHHSVTHTAEEASPWWKVDLGSSPTIYYVDIFNRTGYENRLSNVTVSISENENFSQAQKMEFPGKNLQAEINAVFENGVKGRYVRIQLNNPTEKFPLSLAEVRVWGK